MVAFGVNRGRYRDGSAIYLSLLFFLFPFFFWILMFSKVQLKGQRIFDIRFFLQIVENIKFDLIARNLV